MNEYEDGQTPEDDMDDGYYEEGDLPDGFDSSVILTAVRALKDRGPWEDEGGTHYAGSGDFY